MKIAVTAPTGNIGSRLVPHLLDAGAETVLLARDPAKVRSFTDRGAKVETGSLEDEGFVARAVAGADALFWLTPPDYGTDDLHAFQRKLGGIGAAAAKAGKVGRVVNLSSIGAQIPSGTGPIVGLHQVENAFNDAGVPVRHLRAAFFMENFLLSLDTIRSMGAFFLPARGDVAMPMVATKDIAAVAARYLLDASWSGRGTAGVHGPEDVSLNQAAAVFGEVLGKPVQYMQADPAQTKEALVGMGIRPNTADLFIEMYEAMSTGRLESAEARTAETTTPTSLAEFARETMKPLI